MSEHINKGYLAPVGGSVEDELQGIGGDLEMNHGTNGDPFLNDSFLDLDHYDYASHNIGEVNLSGTTGHPAPAMVGGITDVYNATTNATMKGSHAAEPQESRYREWTPVPNMPTTPMIPYFPPMGKNANMVPLRRYNQLGARPMITESPLMGQNNMQASVYAPPFQYQKAPAQLRYGSNPRNIGNSFHGTNARQYHNSGAHMSNFNGARSQSFHPSSGHIQNRIDPALGASLGSSFTGSQPTIQGAQYEHVTYNREHQPYIYTAAQAHSGAVNGGYTPNLSAGVGVGIYNSAPDHYWGNISQQYQLPSQPSGQDVGIASHAVSDDNVFNGFDYASENVDSAGPSSSNDSFMNNFPGNQNHAYPFNYHPMQTRSKGRSVQQNTPELDTSQSLFVDNEVAQQYSTPDNSQSLFVDNEPTYQNLSAPGNSRGPEINNKSTQTTSSATEKKGKVVKPLRSRHIEGDKLIPAYADPTPVGRAGDKRNPRVTGLRQPLISENELAKIRPGYNDLPRLLCFTVRDPLGIRRDTRFKKVRPRISQSEYEALRRLRNFKWEIKKAPSKYRLSKEDTIKVGRAYDERHKQMAAKARETSANVTTASLSDEDAPYETDYEDYDEEEEIEDYDDDDVVDDEDEDDAEEDEDEDDVDDENDDADEEDDDE